jgi:transposase
MPRPYSGDLRCRVVAAVLDGGQARGSVARRFLVGRSTVCRWVEAAQSEGRLVANHNRLTLAEHRDRLAEETGARVHRWMLGRTLWRLGLTREKEEPARPRAGRGRARAGAGDLAGRYVGHPGRTPGRPQ